MLSKILNRISFKENKRRYLNLKGILSRRYAYKAPDVVQIDLTNRCNSHCLICWINSPHVEEHKNADDRDLDLSTAKDFIDDIAKSGTKEIIFSGGGEPFAYPNIWEVLEFTQDAGLTFRINTNFTLLNRKDIARLLSFDKLTSLTISIWAGEASLYTKIHNREADSFCELRNNLEFLNASKSPNLHVIAYAVISNMNYLGLRSLVDLVAQAGCNAIEFGVPDVIPGVTDSFLLSKQQLTFLKRDFINIAKGLNRKNFGVELVNKDIFLRRISDPRAYFGEYDSFIDKSPCYAGWFFLRLRANGDFNSCLKSHRIPIGNIYREGFLSVWNNPLQQEFRERTLRTPKDRKYFRDIGNGNDGTVGCKRVCDNILVNEHWRGIVKYFFWI